MLARLWRRMRRAGTAALNPIALLDGCAGAGDIAYIPLVYGYVTYATRREVLCGSATRPPRRAAHRLDDRRNRDRPLARAAHRLTPARAPGLAARPRAPATFIPEHDGQPAPAAAWTTRRVNAAVGRLLLGARSPRSSSPGCARASPDSSRFQAAASAIVRDARGSAAHEPRAAARRRLPTSAAAARAARRRTALKEQHA